jgi:hypothetical protein
MRQGEKLKKLVDSKQISVLRISEEVGKSRQFIYNCFNRDVLPNDLKSKVIELLEIPPDYFDVSESEVDNSLINVLKEQIADLRRNNEFLQRLLIDKLSRIEERMLGKDDAATVIEMYPECKPLKRTA